VRLVALSLASLSSLSLAWILARRADFSCNHQGLPEAEINIFRAHGSVQQPREQTGIALDATVRDTLASLGLQQHYGAFEREGIRARNLGDLALDDLAELVRVFASNRFSVAHIIPPPPPPPLLA
jgi:hypothetical protein